MHHGLHVLGGARPEGYSQLRMLLYVEPHCMRLRFCNEYATAAGSASFTNSRTSAAVLIVLINLSDI